MELTVKTSHPYKIRIESGCLNQVGMHAGQLFPAGAKAMIVGDTNVLPIYGDAVEHALTQNGFSCFRFMFPAGEQSKRLSVVEQIYCALADSRFTRSDFIVALGGGVTGDMAGLAAATFLRGIRFLQIPTSLLAQIDSSVGGKTGVDLPQGKNLVGAFHQPSLVLIDPQTLATLPPRYFSDGMGEAVKYGCIKSRALFDLLRTAGENVGSDPAFLEKMITDCVDIKREVVEHDELDTGERMLLNFGHTFGHALEKLYDFRKLSHGEAVGIGMVMMTRLSEKAGLTKPGTADEIAEVLQKYQLPVCDEMGLEKIFEATAVDKKSNGHSLRVILLKEIGSSLIQTYSREEFSKFCGLKDGMWHE